MRIRCTGICRGRGVAYLALRLSAPTECSEILFSSYSEEGVELPVEAYRTELSTGRAPAGAINYIVAVPLLETKLVRISASAVDTTGAVLAKRTKTFSRFVIKWTSRFNYRFRYDDAMAMRDIDNSTYSKQIHIRPEVYVYAPAKDEIIAKGYACLPEDDHAEFSLIDGMGRTCSSFSLTTGKVEQSKALGLSRREVSFTLRVPAQTSTYCLIAKSAKGNRSGFLCLDPSGRRYYEANYSPLLFRCASPVEHKRRSIARSRILTTLDPSDYADVTGPLFSVIVPLYKTPISFLKDMVSSVQAQLYAHWELLLINSTPEDKELTEALSELNDPRIKVITLEKNLGISGNTNIGIDAASGDYVVFFDHDDVLDPFALLKYAMYLNEHPATDALYCDEDFLNEDGEYIAPHYKSDFNLDLLRCHNYITHLFAVRSSYAKELMLRPEFDGAQDYDFILRLVDRTRSIAHIPDVLYHWRISDTSTAKSAGNKNYADEAGRKALQEHLDRQGIAATVSSTDSACFYHVDYKLDGSPKVSILIPNKDNVDVLKRCIDSIFSVSSYSNFEIVIIENNSVEASTFDYYETLQQHSDNIRVVIWDREFNYSAINNFGAKFATGDYLLLLNNDVEVISSNWLSSLLGFCQRDDVGVVGAKLLFADDTVQHAGVLMIKCQNVNDNAGPLHAFSHLDRDDPGYMRRAGLAQDVSIVTGACLMTPKELYVQMGGLDEDFAVAFNDVDYCLRVREQGKLVVFDPDALLYHYESLSRGSDTSAKNAERFIREQGKLRTAWSKYYVNGDPYFGPACTVSYYSELP